MKRFIVVLLFGSSIIFSQGKQTESFEVLKYHLNQNFIIEDDEIIIQKYKDQKKNNGVAIILSAILPGMGELYADGYSSGQYFTIADGVLWAGLIGVSAYANNQEENYRTFAEVNGGVELKGKDDQYFADISGYLDVYEYNHLQELDRNLTAVYNEQSHYWKWSGQTERREYRAMWKSSETANNSTRFIVGALILNRVASVINAVRLVNKYNKNLKTELGWDLSFNYSNDNYEPEKISMNFRTTF
jgi:hypothetical protein